LEVVVENKSKWRQCKPRATILRFCSENAKWKFHFAFSLCKN
jgi:hypothetical protein